MAVICRARPAPGHFETVWLNGQMVNCVCVCVYSGDGHLWASTQRKGIRMYINCCWSSNRRMLNLKWEFLFPNYTAYLFIRNERR